MNNLAIENKESSNLVHLNATSNGMTMWLRLFFKSDIIILPFIYTLFISFPETIHYRVVFPHAEAEPINLETCPSSIAISMVSDRYSLILPLANPGRLQLQKS